MLIVSLQTSEDGLCADGQVWADAGVRCCVCCFLRLVQLLTPFSHLLQSVQSSAQSKSIVSTSSASSCVSTSCLHPGQLSQLLFGDITTVDISSLIAFALTSDGTASALFENSIAPAIVTGQAGLQKPA